VLVREIISLVVLNAGTWKLFLLHVKCEVFVDLKPVLKTTGMAISLRSFSAF
jgi:hypothetical protein